MAMLNYQRVNNVKQSVEYGLMMGCNSSFRFVMVVEKHRAPMGTSRSGAFSSSYLVKLHSFPRYTYLIFGCQKSPGHHADPI